MSSVGLQIHLQAHRSKSNASKHEQLTNKIVLFSLHAALYIDRVLQNDETNLRVAKSQLCSCFSWAVVIRSFQDYLDFKNDFRYGHFYGGSSQDSYLGQEQLKNMDESVKADNTKRATKWGLNPIQTGILKARTYLGAEFLPPPPPPLNSASLHPN